MLLVPADELEQGPPTTRGQPHQVGLADVPKQPKQLHHAEDDLPAQVGSLAPILGEDQEEKEEVLPGFSRCRRPCRVADSGPKAKVSHHLMMPLPSLKLCPPMCGLNSEPILRPDLSPANCPSNPGLLMSRGQPQQKGLADGWGQSRLQQMSLYLRA